MTNLQITFQSSGNLRPKSVAVLLLCFGALLWLGLSYNQICLLNGSDGEAWKITIESELQNRAIFTFTGVDPFQGNFDAWYPTYAEYLLPVAVSSLIGLEPHGPFGDTFLYFEYSLLLLLATYLVGRTVGFTQSVSLIGGFATTAAAFPTIAHHTPLFYALFGLNPHISQVAILSLIMVASFWASSNTKTITSVTLAVVPALCVIIAILATAPYVVLMLPALAIYGGGSLINAQIWRENIPRVFSAALAFLLPLALGMHQYLYSMTHYTAFNFFSEEFEQTRSDLIFASTWFSTNSTGKAIFVAGFIGAIYAAIFETGKLRRFAIIHAGGFFLFLASAVSVVKFGQFYQGPSPVYFETCMWPYTILFAAFAGISIGTKFCGAVKQRAAAVAMPFQLQSGVLLMGIVGVIALYDAFAIWHRPQGCVATFSPVQPSVITETLRRDISMVPGAKFNGIAATIDGVGNKPAVGWLDFHTYDASLWRETGNDHRIVGLWRYRIPTLFQYFSFISPPYYLLLTEFLARREDRQTRSVLVLSRIDTTMMKLWGVRFLITDDVGFFGNDIASLKGPSDTKLRLFELPDPNLGQYSPTKMLIAQDFKSGLALLRDRDFDATRDVVVNEIMPGDLAPATQVRLVYEKYGFDIYGESPMESVIVLPLQYSHCWTFSGARDVHLFRANLMQLGVRFHGKLDGKLVFSYGPVWNSACRLADLADMSILHISQARKPHIAVERISP